MTFFEEFWLVFRQRPAEALLALYWYVLRKRVRARNRLRRHAASYPFAYRYWVKLVERAEEVAARADAEMANWKYKPLISIIPIGIEQLDSEQREVLLAALSQQRYPHYEIVIPCPTDDLVAAGTVHPNVQWFGTAANSPGDLTKASIAAARGVYVLPLQQGTQLSALALYRYVEALQTAKQCAVLYGDEDVVDQAGTRSAPWFKPQWNREMFYAQDYISQACLIETGLARKSAAAAPLDAEVPCYDLLLEVAARANGAIEHVPHVVCHRQQGNGTPSQDAWVRVVTKHLTATATVSKGQFGTVRVSWPLPVEQPLVSIIIPTKDKVDLLSACVGSIREKTTYSNYEIVIVDNASSERRTIEFLRNFSSENSGRVVSYNHAYNYSAINNFAANQVDGQFVCLLNNDTEVLSEDWLVDLMRYAVRPEIGAVGAKLLYDDRSIQHAGVVIGMGGAAGHAHRHLADGAAGYFAQAHVARFVSAVTGACLVIDKAKFLAVGGLDAEGLKVAFNDVDLCLKLQEAGWHNVYVPQAVLLHHESKSRGSDLSSQHIARYLSELRVLQMRWQTENYVDPLHHPMLDRSSETYVLRI